MLILLMTIRLTHQPLGFSMRRLLYLLGVLCSPSLLMTSRPSKLSSRNLLSRVMLQILHALSLTLSAETSPVPLCPHVKLQQHATLDPTPSPAPSPCTSSTSSNEKLKAVGSPICGPSQDRRCPAASILVPVTVTVRACLPLGLRLLSGRPAGQLSAIFTHKRTKLAARQVPWPAAEAPPEALC